MVIKFFKILTVDKYRKQCDIQLAFFKAYV